jgi:hypothetical protein
MKKTFSWGFKINNFAGEKIDEKSGCEKGFIPVF